MSRVRIAIIGVGGFAVTHIESIQRCQDRGLCTLDAVVARRPYNPANREEERADDLRAKGVRVYDTYDELLRSEQGRLDLVTVPLGIRLHAPVSIAALAAGFHVFCEKPAAGTIADALRMRSAQQRSGKLLAIGYQHLLTPAIQYLKSLQLSGSVGRLVRARTIVKWPRHSGYYSRNEWAGHLQVDGEMIYDSPMQNAAAHFLQNMLYVAGRAADETAWPVEVYAENYRANAIDSADTQFVRISTDTDATITFVASHALAEEEHPYTEFEFERARIAWHYDGGLQTSSGGRAAGEGETINLIAEEGTEGAATHDLPFIDVCRAISDGAAPRSTISNAIQHVASVGAAFESSGGVAIIPESERSVRPLETSQSGSGADGGALTRVEVHGLSELLSRCYAQSRGPAELGVAWGRPGVPVRPDRPR